MKKVLPLLFALLIIVQLGAGAFANVDFIVTAQAGGTISPGPDTETSKTVTAVPDSGYAFAYWYFTMEDGSTNTSTNQTEVFDKYESVGRTVTAVFTLNQHTITVNAGTGGTASGSGTYSHGENVTISATPNSGYTFSHWVSGGSPVSYNATDSFPALGDITYTAVFSGETHTVTATVDPSSAGYINSSASYSGSFDYSVNPVASLTAQPVSGYVFDGWYENGSKISSSASEIFDTNRNRTLVAKFLSSSAGIFDPSSGSTSPTITVVPPAGTTYTITYQPGAGASGSVYSHSYNVNEVAYLLGSGYYSKPGHTQTGWTEDYNGAGYKYNLNSGFILTKNVTLYPYWEKSTVPLNLTVSIGPGGGVRLSGGTVPNGWTGKLEPNQSFTFYFHPNPGNYVYRIGMAGWHWPVQSGNSFTVTYEMMQGKNQTLQILFADARSHPPTGDDSQIALHIALGLASLTGLIVLEVVRRKRNKEAEKEAEE